MIEVAAGQEEAVVAAYAEAGLPCSVIGSTRSGQEVSIAVAGRPEITGERGGGGGRFFWGCSSLP